MQKNKKLIESMENIFRTSNSPEELFDAFRVAIENKVKDEELYKILLRNKALSIDEISMYTEKICKVFPDVSYNIFFCVGQLLESISSYGKHNEKAFSYFMKSAGSAPASNEPYLAISKMYNAELNVPRFEVVAETVEDGISKVEIKSPLCFALSNLYLNRGDKEKALSYQKLGEIYQREGK